MEKIYHVATGYAEGDDLLSLAAQIARNYLTLDEAIAQIETRWPDVNAWEYWDTEGSEIHCHATIEEAKDYAAEYGGTILEITTDGPSVELEIRQGREYPHPVTMDVIPASHITIYKD